MTYQVRVKRTTGTHTYGSVVYCRVDNGTLAITQPEKTIFINSRDWVEVEAIEETKEEQ